MTYEGDFTIPPELMDIFASSAWRHRPGKSGGSCLDASAASLLPCGYQPPI